MSGGKVDIAARQAWFEEQADLAESEWIDFFQERLEDGDDVPDKEHFIALWLAERDPLATDLAAAIARAEAAEADVRRLDWLDSQRGDDLPDELLPRVDTQLTGQ